MGAVVGDIYGVLAVAAPTEGVSVPKPLLPMRFMGGTAAAMDCIVGLMG